MILQWLLRKHWVSAAVAAAMLAAAAGLIDYTDLLRRWNDLYYDFLVRLDTEPAPEDVVIVEIDQRSLNELGSWPWPRTTHARLVEQLTLQKARGIIYDIAFVEPDRHGGGHDQRLVDAIAANGQVALPVFPEAVESGSQLVEVLPFPALAQATNTLGHVDLELSSDGVAREVFLYAGLRSPHWPHLALAGLQAAGQDRPDANAPQLLARANTPHDASVLAWVRRDLVRIPFGGPPGHFKRVSFVDVLQGNLPNDLLSGRLVLVGMAASGLGEIVPTPVSESSDAMSGVEIVAHVLVATRQNRFYHPIERSLQIFTTALLVLLGTLFSYHLLRGKRRLWAAAVACVPLFLSGALLLFSRHWFEPAASFLVFALAYPTWQWGDIRGLNRILRHERRAAKNTLQRLAEAVLKINAGGKVGFMNPAAEQLTEWSAQDALGRQADEVFRAVDEDRGLPFRLPETRRAGTKMPEYWILSGHYGTRRVIRATLGFSTGPDLESPDEFVITFYDVTAERRLTEQLRHLASYDVLTDLPNRSLLNDRLQQAMARAKRQGHLVAIMVSDLDDFKKINDTLGHASGDALLQVIGKRLMQTVRDGDTVARIGGDEFIILIEQLTDTSTAGLIAQKLLEAIHEPLTLDGHQLSVTSSAGLSFFPSDGSETDDLLRCADLAMYSAKDKGGNAFVVYRPTMQQRARERFTLENDLKQAIEKDELRLVYQPFVDLKTERIIGAEALVRWNHPTRGILGAETIVQLAERCRCIVPIGAWVLRTACRRFARWQALYGPPLRIAVNLSPKQLASAAFPKQVEEILEETGMAPAHLELEITEGILMGDAFGERETLRQLAALGIGLTIDDFGTGYSSFSYLKRLPVARLKIDRSFIAELTSNEADEAIVKAILAMAGSLRLSTTAEGVETPDQASILHAIGCEECQGFYYAKPLDEQSYEQLLRRQSPPRPRLRPVPGPAD